MSKLGLSGLIVGIIGLIGDIIIFGLLWNIPSEVDIGKEIIGALPSVTSGPAATFSNIGLMGLGIIGVVSVLVTIGGFVVAAIALGSDFMGSCGR
jgi:hypothetical protein